MIQLGIDFVVADNDLILEFPKKLRPKYKEINVIFVTHLLGSPSDTMIKKLKQF